MRASCYVCRHPRRAGKVRGTVANFATCMIDRDGRWFAKVVRVNIATCTVNRGGHMGLDSRGYHAQTHLSNISSICSRRSSSKST